MPRSLCLCWKSALARPRSALCCSHFSRSVLIESSMERVYMSRPSFSWSSSSSMWYTPLELMGECSLLSTAEWYRSSVSSISVTLTLPASLDASAAPCARFDVPCWLALKTHDRRPFFLDGLPISPNAGPIIGRQSSQKLFTADHTHATTG